jgi:hypothetical protein
MPELIAYASRTGTRRNLDALRDRGWRLLVSAAGVHRHEGFPYAIDNGAWSAFTKGKPIDLRKFEQVLRKLGAGADFAVMPDIVAGGLPSLELSLAWMRRVLDECPRGLLAVQDGMTVADVEPMIGERVGIFVGGSTAWKLDTLTQWARLARSKNAWCHVGRVNSQKRIHKCAGAGATSFDGTSASKYALTLPPLDAAVRQQTLHLDDLEAS